MRQICTKCIQIPDINFVSVGLCLDEAYR